MTDPAASSVPRPRRTPLRSLAAGLVTGLFGPMPLFEVVRASRRGRFHLLRIVFVLLLLLSLWLAFQHFQTKIGEWEGRTDGQDVAADRRQELARFAETFFFAFLGVQFAAVLLVTPVWLGGAIAEEKDRRRLEFLLATSLGNSEIILGKLAAGLGSLGLLLLAGLPVLAMMQFWGGIDPNLVLIGYAVTAVTMLSIGALTVLCSVHARKPRDAVLMTYLLLVVFLVVSLLCRFVQRDSVLGWNWLASISDGNLGVVLYQVREGWDGEDFRDSTLPKLLLHYGVFHGALTLLCVTAAVLRLRRAAWPRSRPDRKAWLGRHRLLRPRIALRPMLWKELFVESRLRLGRFGWTCVVLVVLASLVPVMWFYVWTSYRGPHYDAIVRDACNVWGRLIVTGGACLALLGVAIHAAGSISGERERHTLDSLLTTPLTPRDILFAKWLGSILSVRRIGLVLLVIWLVCTGFSGSCVVLLIACAVAWVVYAGCFAMLGLWFSATCRSTRRATLWTLGVLTLLGIGHWVPWFFVRQPDQLKLPHTVAFFGLTPPAALHWAALQGDDLAAERLYSSRLFERFSVGEYSLRNLVTRSKPWARWDELAPMYQDEVRDILAGTAAGLVFWLGLTAVLWPLTLRRLARINTDSPGVSVLGFPARAACRGRAVPVADADNRR
jgi:ABC-type transport system involved in multi-copper enzyme maturation permease subunit